MTYGRGERRRLGMPNYLAPPEKRQRYYSGVIEPSLSYGNTSTPYKPKCRSKVKAAPIRDSSMAMNEKASAKE